LCRTLWGFPIARRISCINGTSWFRQQRFRLMFWRPGSNITCDTDYSDQGCYVSTQYLKKANPLPFISSPIHCSLSLSLLNCKQTLKNKLVRINIHGSCVPERAVYQWLLCVQVVETLHCHGTCQSNQDAQYVIIIVIVMNDCWTF
jgi:hypothetical protein